MGSCVKKRGSSFPCVLLRSRAIVGARDAIILERVSCCGCLRCAGDFIPHVFEEFPALRDTILTDRAFVVSMVAVFFLLPLSLLRGAWYTKFFEALSYIG